MRVIYDARVIEYQYTGLGRFAGELLFKLLETAAVDNIQYTVLVWRPTILNSDSNYLYQKLKKLQLKSIFTIVEISERPISLGQHLSFYRNLNSLNGDVYFYPHFDLPLGLKIPSVFMVHDLFPLKVPGYITKYSTLKILYFKLMLKWCVRKAAYIFALSNTTREDLIQEVGAQFKSKIGASLAGPIVGDFVEISDKDLNLTLPTNFLLYVGDRRPHKDIKRIVDLFTTLKDGGLYAGALVIAGSQKNFGFKLEEYISGRSDIFLVGQIDDAHLDYCYRNMDALVFLSKYEGLGLPVLEAGRLGKKMIISDGGALPEFAPPWAYLLPKAAALDAHVEAIGDYLQSSHIVDQPYKDKFTWDIAAERIKNKFIEIGGMKYE